MLNKSKADYAYNIIDISSPLTDKTIEAINNIDGVVKVRILSFKR